MKRLDWFRFAAAAVLIGTIAMVSPAPKAQARGVVGPTAPPPRGYLRAPHNMWTGFWVVPDDAPTRMLVYTVTATDKFGRTATFTSYPYENSQLTIVQ